MNGDLVKGHHNNLFKYLQDNDFVSKAVSDLKKTGSSRKHPHSGPESA